jgi:hypothetical protein
MQPNALVKQQEKLDELSHEAMQIIEILDQIETHTADLRKKLMAELKKNTNPIVLELDEINN